MFFGLTNSLATFQMMMNTIFRREVALGWLSVYMDDIAIHTSQRTNETEAEHQTRHREYVHIVLDKLEENDLYLKPEKCDFEKKEIDYLGLIVGGNKLKMDPKKLRGVADWVKPTNPTEIHKFLGFTGYYRYFVPNYSKITRPLLDLTNKTCITPHRILLSNVHTHRKELRHLRTRTTRNYEIPHTLATISRMD